MHASLHARMQAQHQAHQDTPCRPTQNTRVVLQGRKKEKSEANVHGDALCFMAIGPSLLQRLAMADGGWWWLAVGGRRLVAVGGWWSLGAVLKGLCLTKKKSGLLRTALQNTWDVEWQVISQTPPRILPVEVHQVHSIPLGACTLSCNCNFECAIVSLWIGGS